MRALTVLVVLGLSLSASFGYADQAANIVRSANEAVRRTLTPSEESWLVTQYGHHLPTLSMAHELMQFGVIQVGDVAWDSRHIALAHELFTRDGVRDIALVRAILKVFQRPPAPPPGYAPPPPPVTTTTVKRRIVVGAAVQPVSGMFIDQRPTLWGSILGAVGQIGAAAVLRPARINISQVGGGATAFGGSATASGGTAYGGSASAAASAAAAAAASADP